MPSLRDLQLDFMESLLAEPLRSTGVTDSRLGLYRGNVRANFLGSLESTFPVLLRLVGPQYFEQTALAFHASNPSRSGDLKHAGQDFPAFIESSHAAGTHRYLGDVARFEWLCQESLLAAEHAPLDLSRLRELPREVYGELVFELHPALMLYESRFPVLKIWQENSRAEREPDPIDLDCGGDRLGIFSRRHELEFHPLGEGEHRFLDALRAGADFSAALEAADTAEPGFDPGATLQRFVAAHIIVDFRQPPRSPPACPSPPNS